MNLGATFIRRGEIDAALQHLHISQDKFIQANTRDFLPELYRHFAEAALVAGTLPEAEAHGQHALGMARELTMRGEEGNSLRVFGLISRAQGQLDQAAAYLYQSLAILEELGDEYESARSRLALAEVLLAQEKKEQGRSELERCAAVFQRLDAVLDLAAAHELREKLAARHNGYDE